MREIEFRRFDKQYGTMHKVNLINFNASDPFEIDHEDNLNEPMGVEFFEFMQYTGIKDINGVKIFEGDILKTKENPKKYCDKCESELTGRFCGSCGSEATNYDSFKIGQCVYSDCAFKMKTLYKDMGFYIEYNIREVYIQSIEVIGNIYQNPELLTKP